MDTKLVHLNPVGGDLYVMRPFHAPHPGQGLPGGGGHPDHTLPGSGIPDNSLPDHPPPTVPPDMVVVLVKTADGKWHWAALPAPAVPAPLPEPPPTAAPKY